MSGIAQHIIEDYALEKRLTVGKVQGHFHQLELFLEACANSDMPCAPSTFVDKVWHYFLMYSAEYREYCNKNFGLFIDHYPSSQGRNMESYIRTRQMIEAKHGRLNRRFWPVGGSGATVCGECSDVAAKCCNHVARAA